MNTTESANFKTMIRLTQAASALRTQLASATLPIEQARLQLALSDADAALSLCCAQVFSNAGDGDDIYLVQGRTPGDDDYTGVLYAQNGEQAAARFKVEYLELPADANDDEEKGRVDCYIITNESLSLS